MPTIPDHESFENHSTEETEVPPSATAPSMKSIAELDADIGRMSGTSKVHADLSVLTSTLPSYADIEEEDLPWDYQTLFTHVKHSLMGEVHATETLRE